MTNNHAAHSVNRLNPEETWDSEAKGKKQLFLLVHPPLLLDILFSRSHKLSHSLGRTFPGRYTVLE